MAQPGGGHGGVSVGARAPHHEDAISLNHHDTRFCVWEVVQGFKGQVLQLGAKIVLHLLCIWTGQAFERTASDSRSESSSPFTGPLERQSAAQFQQVIEGLRGESTVIQARIKQRTDMLVRLSMFPDLRWKSYFPPPTLNQDGRTTILAPLRWRNRLGLRGEKRPAGADRRGPGGDRASMALPQ